MTPPVPGPGATGPDAGGAAPWQAFRGLPVEQAYGYAQARRGGGFIWVAGQVGRDPAGVTPEEPAFERSIALALEWIDWALGEAGATRADLVALQSFVAAPLAEALPVQRAALRAWLAEADGRPALTTVEVAALNRDTFLIELSAVAADPHVAGPGAGELVCLGDVVAADLSGGVAEQLAGALAAVAGQLAARGSSMGDVVAEHVYLTERPTDPEGFAALIAAHRAGYPGPGLPTSTMVYVPALPVPGAKALVAVTAVVPAGRAGVAGAARSGAN